MNQHRSNQKVPLKFTTGFILILLCHTSFATLEICIFNNNALYVGSDSLVTQGTNRFLTRKIFAVSDTCCLTISDNFGSLIRDEKTGSISLCFFPKQIRSITDNSRLSKAPLQNSISNCVVEFRYIYDNWMRMRLPTAGTNNETLPTRLSFWGHDKTKDKFFGSSCLFKGTNHVALETMFERGAKNYGASLWLQGEGQFLKGLIKSSQKPFVDLRSDEFKKTADLILAESPLPEKDIVQFMLEMFRLHKKYAGTFSTDKGSMDEPFVVFKITKNGIVKIR